MRLAIERQNYHHRRGGSIRRGCARGRAAIPEAWADRKAYIRAQDVPGRPRLRFWCMMRTALEPAAEIRLVVNADDFGLSAGISRGIVRAHREGIVTSTSLLGNCPDLDRARALLAEAPNLGVGVHLALVEGGPVADAARVPTLLAADGRFRSRGAEFIAAWTKRHIDAGDVEREFDAQIARVRDAGIKVDHLDTHHHLGFLPVVGRTVEA